MQTNCTAYAKVVVNKKLNTVRLLVTFDTASNTVTVRNAAFVSGDICNKADANLQAYVATELERAKVALRTNNIVVL
jgi:hypothetical protein